MKNKQKFYQDKVIEVNADFAERQKARRPYELSWQLNMNFLMGNQYCDISPRGSIEQEDKSYYWQEKQVFNHIAPIVETRLARLNRVRPKMSVRPFSNSDDDISCAKTSTKILESVSDSISLNSLINNATAWSEVTGTSFYKVLWDKKTGQEIDFKDKKVNLGDVKVVVCSPFEIFPDSNVNEDINDCHSIIHAKSYSSEEVNRIWGENIVGRDVKVFSLDKLNASVGGFGYNSTVPSITGEIKHDQVVVIERYTLPNLDYPNGELVIVANDKILYYGELPYFNGNNGERTFPFVKQVAHRQVGCFWGASIIERIIPLQRSYNAVKNRKHEFLNRLAMGVMTVEDGSIDTENLEQEGLCPGKILVFRQGATKPSMLDAGNVPADFSYEEDRLLNEFVVISGVSELARNSATPTNVTSGVALQLLIDQDDSRLSATAEQIRDAIKSIGKQILRLYKQYAFAPRLAKTLGENSVESYYFNNSNISSFDIVFDTENELNDSPTSRRNMVLQLLSMGVLFDEDGKLGENTKLKIIDLMGLGNWENARDISRIHQSKAQGENVDLTNPNEILDIDDHKIHISEHTAFIISGEAKKISQKREEILLQHIAMHKKMSTLNQILGANTEVNQ